MARRAAEQASAAGISLPEHLSIWSLAGGRPTVTAGPGEPGELGDVLESVTPRADRRRQGAHYTPAPLADGLAARALEGRGAVTVADPACGGGALLLAAARMLAVRGQAPARIVERLWGMDVDPVAVATTEVALTLWAGSPPPMGHLVVGDALLDDPGWPPMDVVIGNPPFLGQLTAATAQSPARRRRLQERYGPAVLAYTDVAGLFLVRSCQLAAPTGVVALLQPQSVLGARDAAGVRAAVGSLGRLREVWVPEDPGFEASVDVCVPVIDRGEDGVVGMWASRLAAAEGVPEVRPATSGCLGDHAVTTAGFRGEYYGLAAEVQEADDFPTGRPLVTTGLIDLGGCAWGQRAARIARRTWRRPVVDPARLTGRAADWAERTRAPKLVVASQTRVVEVAVDEDGTWIPGVPLVAVLASPARLWSFAAALGSPAVSAWLLHRSAGTALTRGGLRLSADLLRRVPLPADDAAWVDGTAAFRARDLDRFAAAMGEAYRVDEAVADWWRARAERVWSPAGPRR